MKYLTPIQLRDLISIVITGLTTSDNKSCMLLMEEGIIEQRPNLQGWVLTAKGDVYMDALKSIPLPVEQKTWVIPTVEDK